MKLLTRNTDYAIRAILFLAENKQKKFSVTELSKNTKVPYQFLRRILQILHKKRLLKSYKGKGGGFSLEIPAKNISLISIAKIFQGDLKLNECLLKKIPCPNIAKCVLRKKLKKIEDYVLRELGKIKISQLLKKESK